MLRFSPVFSRFHTICSRMIFEIYYIYYKTSVSSGSSKRNALYIIRSLLRYIINSEGIAYHQAAGQYTLTRDDISKKMKLMLSASIRILCSINRGYKHSFNFDTLIKNASVVIVTAFYKQLKPIFTITALFKSNLKLCYISV